MSEPEAARAPCSVRMQPLLRLSVSQGVKPVQLSAKGCVLYSLLKSFSTVC